MNYGYIRVSTRDQNEERQRLAMGELEIPEKNLYRDHQSGKDFGPAPVPEIGAAAEAGRRAVHQEH